MSGPALVGVLGASGVVGRAAVAALRSFGVERIRLGGRRLDALSAVAAELPGVRAATVRVDLRDPARLAQFCADCRVVLNCAGPSYRLHGRVAAAAAAAGADYVDVAGDDPAHADLRQAGLPDPGRSAVLSAGMLPGLSALIPRWLAVRQQEIDGTSFSDGRLAVWAGGLERCSRTVAADLVLSLGLSGPAGTEAAHGEPSAAWRDGRRVGRALSAHDAAELAFFPGTVALRPYLSTEAERLAQALGLAELDWFNVFPGRRVRDLLTSLSTSTHQRPTPLGAAVDRLVTAAELDLAGHRPYYRMVFCLSTADGAAATATTAVLGTTDSYRLTGTVGALAVAATLAGRVPAGLHYAAEVLDPEETVRRIGSTPGVTLDVSRGAVELADAVGAL